MGIIEGTEEHAVPAKIVMRYRSMAGVPEAMAAGLGLAALPASLYEEPALRNVVVPVLTDHRLRQLGLYVVYSSRRSA